MGLRGSWALTSCRALRLLDHAHGNVATFVAKQFVALSKAM
jgi:hypothetical protein